MFLAICNSRVAALFIFLLTAFAAAEAATITATSGSAAHVQAAMNSARAGDTVVIPAGTFTWTNKIVWTAPANITLKGAGSLTTPGGGDATVIVDNYDNSAGLLSITASTNGVLRIAGITFRGSAYSTQKENGIIGFDGGVFPSPAKVRIDHCHFDFPNLNVKIIWLSVYGVLDNCIFDLSYGSGVYFDAGRGVSRRGDEAWAAPTGFGTANFFYLEDNIFHAVGPVPTRIGDVYSGGRCVYRFNTMQGTAGLEVHATGHAFGDRGARAQEGYANLYTTLPGQENPPYAMADTSSGTALIWGNVSEEKNLKTGIVFNVTRKNSDTYPESPTPDAWGYAGPAPMATGTVNVANGTNVTYVNGNLFNTSWPAGSMIWIEGSSCENNPGQAPGRISSGGIASVNSTTSITLKNGGHRGANLTNVRYVIGSPWDGNTDPTGYPCLDQPGRGQGNLLTGNFPSKVNATTGTIAWPNQALEPIYIWNNYVVPHPGYSGGSTSIYNNNTGGRVQANRDYYPQASGIQTSPTSPFDGTAGTGWGTLANRPTTCTPGVAYWATDQGSWNTSTTNTYGVQQNGADGVLYKCTATNVWTPYYTPYTYPHPLRAGMTTSNTPSAPNTPRVVEP